MAKGTFKRKPKRPSQKRGGGGKMNTCLKRAQRATMRWLEEDEKFSKFSKNPRAPALPPGVTGRQKHLMLQEKPQ